MHKTIIVLFDNFQIRGERIILIRYNDKKPSNKKIKIIIVIVFCPYNSSKLEIKS